MLMWEAMELSSCPRVIIDSTGKGEITMKKALILALAACLTLTCSACAFTPEAALVETPQSSDNYAAELDEPSLPEEITDGASDIYTSWLDSGRGYLLKKGFPAAGQMVRHLYIVARFRARLSAQKGLSGGGSDALYAVPDGGRRELDACAVALRLGTH